MSEPGEFVVGAVLVIPALSAALLALLPGRRAPAPGSTPSRRS
jgi:hypothetical protein